MRDVETGEISTETVSSMITDSTMMTVVECPHPLRGVGHMCLDSMKTDALTVASGEFQSTQGSQALMRNLFSYKVWLTGTEHKEKART